MAFTTTELVQGIIETQPGMDITPFIDTAHSLITSVCLNSGYTNERLEMIERWLSAHFYTIFDNQLAMAKAGTVAVDYQYMTEMFLKASMYGQQAMLLDTAGNLAGLSNTLATQRTIKIGLKWAGQRWFPYDTTVIDADTTVVQ